jgi:D-beta-D-heptose 7-phosphate kinase/D-beta-D-heptose 1-phosphate adenosyltransferase
LGRIINRSDLTNEVRNWREEKKVIVFTNGCFDLIHRGHVEYLNKAKSMGDILILGLNSDTSVKKLKGPDRPYVSEQDRAYILSHLVSVDAVSIFEEDTPLNLIKMVMPDILVKGGDYTPETIVGRKEVEQKGGDVVAIPLLEGRSTTGLIEKIKKSNSG